MKELELDNVSCNFISGWYINEDVCDDLISYFEESPNKKPGVVGRGIDKEFKISTDVTVIPRDNDKRIQNYLLELSEVCDNYIKKFPYCSKYHSTWGINTNFNIQKYEPNEGFFGWHTERTTSSDLIPLRHLVFMTYLNNVEDSGETEWFYQKIKIKPQKGLTVIWPCDWTHFHRGIPSPSQKKYITTGWYTYRLDNFDYTEYNGG